MSAVCRSKESQVPTDLRGVQALRGVAALMVVGFHATQVWAGHVSPGGEVRPWVMGSRGVDIFFVISGVVMIVSSNSRKAKSHPARRFLVRRLIRIAPMYWLMTGVFLLKMLAEHLRPQLENGTQHAAITPPYLVCSLLFIPYRNSLGIIQPPLAVGWSLSFEMFFYLLFAAALALRMRAALLLTPVLLLLAAIGLFLGAGGPAVMVLANPLLLEFLAGVLIGSLLERGGRLKSGTASVLAVIGFLVILAMPAPEMAWWAWMVPATAGTSIVLASVMSEERLRITLPGWVLRIGDASYSLYLSHMLVFSAMARVLMWMHLLTPGVVRRRDEALVVALLMILSTAISLLVYQFVEAPLNRTLRRGLRLREARLQESEISQMPSA